MQSHFSKYIQIATKYRERCSTSLIKTVRHHLIFTRIVKVKVTQSCPTLCDPMDWGSWNSPDQNTGEGCHVLLQGIFPDQGWNPGLPHCRWILLPPESPGKPKNTGVGSLSLLQGIFPIQGLKPGLPHCRQSLYQLSHKGSPRILKWVANPFSSGSSRPRNRTRVSCIAGRFFTN